LFGTALAALPLAGCSGSSLTPTVIVAAAGTVAKGLAGAVSAIASAYPTLIPADMLATIQTDLALAQTAAGQLSATLPAATGASVVQTVEGYINAVLNLLAGPPINGLIPAPFNQVIGAAAIVVPVLEAFVAQYLPAASASPARVKLAASVPGMTRAQAMAVLKEYAR
jgi:hypothetical protein